MHGAHQQDGDEQTVRGRKSPSKVLGKRPATSQMVARGTACLECKRRKVACSSQRPCSSCIRYRCVERCIDRKSEIKLTQCVAVLHKLFPEQDITEVVNYSREQLLTTLNASLSSMEVERRSADVEVSPAPPDFEVDVESSPRGYSWSEEASVADDVNGLSLGSSSSYLGMPSLSTIFSELRKLGQDIRPLGGQVKRFSSEGDSYSGFQKQNFPAPYARSNYLLIDSYFLYVHPIVPIVHEATFRDAYATQSQKRQWLALLYSVLMWGKLASLDSRSCDEGPYYRAARYYLGDLGRGNEQVLQALILLGGHYLHLKNMPNTAMVLSGVAFKIACGLGLHRRLSTKTLSQVSWLQKEQRRRLWFALYTAEVSGGFSLGRPSLYAGQGITIEEPGNIDDISGEDSGEHVTPTSVLICRIGLSRIMERVETLFMLTRLPKESEAESLDAELRAWYNQSPLYLHEPVGAPLGIYMALRALKWEYNNIRIALYRPFLLRSALTNFCSTTNHNHSEAVVSICREIAAQAIVDISSEWRPHLLSCWPGVWYMFQAALIPVISLFSAYRYDTALRQKLQQQVKNAIDTLEQMCEYRDTASQSIQVLWSLFRASERLQEPPVVPSELVLDTTNDPILNPDDQANIVRQTLLTLFDPMTQRDWLDNAR